MIVDDDPLGKIHTYPIVPLNHGPANSRARDILDKFILYVGYRTVLKSCYCHNHTPQVEKRFGTMLYQPLGTAPLNVFPAEGRICSVIKG